MRPAALVLLATLVPAHAAEGPDPWRRVPALPTTCYQADGFEARVAAARADLDRDLERQKQVNERLTEQIKSIDPMELAQRQQQFMMDHPQEAMALMQRNANLGETFSNDEVAAHEARTKLDEDLSALDGRYKAALDVALKPIHAKFTDLEARAQKDPVRTEAGDFYAAWAVKEWNALTVEENAAYERVCATWWSASGPYQDWLTKLRANLAASIPRREEAENVGAGFMVQLVSSPTATYRPTAPLNAVRDYMDGVDKVLARRRREPGKPAESVTHGRGL